MHIQSMDTLEDVIITEPVAICAHPLDNVYADMLFRSGQPFTTNAEVVEFLAAMVKAHDAVKRRHAADELVTNARYGAGNITHDIEAARIRKLLGEGDSIIDIAVEDYDGVLCDAVRALTSGKPTIMEEWSEPFWGHIETAATTFDGGIRKFAEVENVTFSQARRLLGWYRNQGRTSWEVPATLVYDV